MSSGPTMTCHDARPAMTSTAKPRAAKSSATTHQSCGRPPWRSGETSTSVSTPGRSAARAHSMRIRTDGRTVPMACRARSPKPRSFSHCFAATGPDGRPAYMSSSCTTPIVSTFGS